MANLNDFKLVNKRALRYFNYLDLDSTVLLQSFKSTIK